MEAVIITIGRQSIALRDDDLAKPTRFAGFAIIQLT
jgi:hypothetical protein